MGRLEAEMQAIAGSRRPPTGGRDPMNYHISGSVVLHTDRPSVFLSLLLKISLFSNRRIIFKKF